LLGVTCAGEEPVCGERPGTDEECAMQCDLDGRNVCVEGPDGEPTWECQCDPIPACGPPPPITDCGPTCSMSVQCVNGSWSCELCQPCRNRTDTCAACDACEQKRECAEQSQICSDSVACRAIADCAGPCADTVCVDACIAANPSGQTRYASLANCICHHCSALCAGVCGAAGG